eukprot:XP_001690612.1 predicted protein [Chlamydomonas reinhardtii]
MMVGRDQEREISYMVPAAVLLAATAERCAVIANQTCMEVAERPTWSGFKACSEAQCTALLLMAMHLASAEQDRSSNQLVVSAAGLLQAAGARCPAWLQRLLAGGSGWARGADATGVQLHLDRLDCYMNQRVAASQSLILPARIRITTSADGALNFGLGNFYLRQVNLTSPAVANLTDTPNTANTAFKAGVDMLLLLPRQSSPYPPVCFPSAPPSALGLEQTNPRRAAGLPRNFQLPAVQLPDSCQRPVCRLPSYLLYG